MRLILVRHGQTICNIEEIWHGWDECELTEAGLQQAEAIAERLKDEPVAAVYSSDSRRAQQTAEAIALRHNLRPLASPDFRERCAGEYQGETFETVLEKNPNVWEERAADYWSWSPPEGESFREVLARTMHGLDEIRALHSHDTVVLVGHMGTVRVLVSHLLDIPITDTYEMDFPSTGLSILRFEPDGIQVEALNDGTHADALSGS